MKSFVVLGLGRFGARLATEISASGAEVLAIDSDENIVEHIADSVTRAVTADAIDKDVLKSLGVQDCDCAIVAFAADLSSSVLSTMHLKTLGVKRVICKARDDTHKEILERIGADRVIIPERVVADKLAVNLTSPNVLDLIELSNDCGIIEAITPKAWAGKTVIELNIRQKYSINLIAIKNATGFVNVNIRPDTVLPNDATLVLLGDYEALNKIK